MEEILTNEELQEIEENEDCVTECSGGGLGKLLIGGLILGVVAAGVAAYKKFQPKLEERKIKNLEKRGYTVLKSDTIEAIVPVEETEVDESETE